MGTCVHFSRSLPSTSWWQTMVGCKVLSRPSAAEGGGRRPAFTGPATQPYSATEVDGWQQLSWVSQNRAAVQLRQVEHLAGAVASAHGGRHRRPAGRADRRVMIDDPVRLGNLPQGLAFMTFLPARRLV